MVWLGPCVGRCLKEEIPAGALASVWLDPSCATPPRAMESRCNLKCLYELG